MIHNLTEEQIEALLHHQTTGRLACSHDNIPYVVPISYAYDGKCMYCQTREGAKIDIMRSNPNVCFQTDELHNTGNWKSVIVNGVFEELIDEVARKHALQLLTKRGLPFTSSVTARLGDDWPFRNKDLDDKHSVVFRIVIKEKHGRCEDNSDSPRFIY